MSLPWSATIQNQISAEDANLQKRLGDIAADESRVDAQYGAKDGALNWNDPSTDPFSVVGQLKRLFRQQTTSLKNEQFSGGWGWDGNSQLEAANQATGHQQQQRDAQNAYGNARGEFRRQRTEAELAARTNKASLQSQLAQAFAAENTATLSAVPQAQVPEAVRAAAPAPNLIARRSAAHGGRMWLYRVNAKGGLTPVRPA
jgi:hypothetical protein